MLRGVPAGPEADLDEHAGYADEVVRTRGARLAGF